MRSNAVLWLAIAAVCGCGEDIDTVPQIVDVSVVVTGAGTGTGTITSQTSGLTINCVLTAGSATGTCAGGFSDAGGVGSFSLLATPATGSTFGSWSLICETSNIVGTCSVSTNQATVQVDYDNIDRAGTVTVDVVASFN